MLLRASGEDESQRVDSAAVVKKDGRGSGVSHGDVLIDLANATLAAAAAGADDQALVAARQGVIAAMGQAALVDSAATIATFCMQNRVTDATGLPLDPPLELATRALRAKHGVNRFHAARHTTTQGAGAAVAARVLAPLTPLVLRLAGRWANRRR